MPALINGDDGIVSDESNSSIRILLLLLLLLIFFLPRLNNGGLSVFVSAR